MEAPRGEFRVNNSRVVTCLALSSVMGLVSLAIVAAGCFLTFQEPVINKRIAAIVMGGCGLALSLMLFASNWKKYGQRVVTLSDGFHFHTGGRQSFVRWDDIIAVWRSSSTIRGSRPLSQTDLWIQASNGNTIHLTSFLLDMDRLVDTVLTETARRMVPANRSRLQAGQTVEFGKLTISATQLLASGKNLAWDDVAAIHVAHGGIDIQRTPGGGSWFYTPVKKMPNYHVFLALAETLLKPAGSQTQDAGAL